jgi:hypothetical protein
MLLPACRPHLSSYPFTVFSSDLPPPPQSRRIAIDRRVCTAALVSTNPPRPPRALLSVHERISCRNKSTCLHKRPSVTNASPRPAVPTSTSLPRAVSHSIAMSVQYATENCRSMAARPIIPPTNDAVRQCRHPLESNHRKLPPYPACDRCDHTTVNSRRLAYLSRPPCCHGAC